MWASIIRFIGLNWVGLASGYAIRDISGAISGADSSENESWLTKALRKLGLPGWFAPFVGLVILIFIAVRMGWLRKK